MPAPRLIKELKETADKMLEDGYSIGKVNYFIINTVINYGEEATIDVWSDSTGQ